MREVAWDDADLQRGGADRSTDTNPGSQAGGLSRIVEKAMGSIGKSGCAPIHRVLAPGEQLQGKGQACYATLHMAAGMNLHVFTTGRQQTWAERWRLHHALMLINPTLVT